MSTTTSPSSSVPTTPTGQKRMSYADGKVYVIRSTLEGHANLCYVGSTTTTLAKRLYQHRKTSKDPSKKCRIYEAMRELGAANWFISLLEDGPCERREQLRAREEWWRRELGAQLNMVRAYVSGEDAREKGRQRAHDWYYTNTERVLARMKARRDNQRAVGYPCTVCNYTANQPQHLTRHLATRRHRAAAMKAHLTTLMAAGLQKWREEKRAREVAALTAPLTA